jgi:tetratricopeptide (TPR) repeat protein/ADP-heptose:LPS heptosyltransferase
LKNKTRKTNLDRPLDQGKLINEAIQVALQYHKTNQLQQAEAMYRKILEIDPDNVYALHLLGVIASDSGHYDSAVKLIEKALTIKPDYAEAQFNLGVALYAKGEMDKAKACFGKTLKLKPDYIMAYFNMGNVMRKQGENTGALICFKRAVELNPDYLDAHYNLGNTLRDMQRYEEAIVCYKKVLELNPDYVQAYNNLGVVLHGLSGHEEAIKQYQRALEIKPDYSEAYNNWGNTLQALGRYDEAIGCYKKALEIRPDYAEAYYNSGNVFRIKNICDEALVNYKKALEIEPENAEAHWNMGIALLLKGDLNQGWKKYEWRWRRKEFSFNKRNFISPLWSGGGIVGCTVLLWTEQGLGDVFQFIRYALMVAEQGARVVVLCQQEVKSLIGNVAGVHEVIGSGEELPAFHVHCPLLSLPLALNTSLENIPAGVPYISADPGLVKKWRERMNSDNAGLKIGLVWAGSPGHGNDRNRSCLLGEFAPLAGVEDITIYSLQKGEASKQAADPPEGMRLVDYTDEIHDFSDTAAIIENLDLVISVDTAVVHLAGAMGKAVWTLLPYSPDWRWMLNRQDSPWYPTMRLFRQFSPGKWGDVIVRIKEELLGAAKVVAAEKNMPAEHIPYKTDQKIPADQDDIAIVLQCEGMGDCLFAMAVIKKISLMRDSWARIVLFTHRRDLFINCPYVNNVYDIHNNDELNKYKKAIVLFDTSKLRHHLVDTFNFISIPAGLGELSFREKQLEYFPVEKDFSEHFDVVINTSVTWPSRSWPIENWQKAADYIIAEGYSVAVVGKDTFSVADNMIKKSAGLNGCTDLANKLSLDQTYYTIKNCSLFITCQNGLSVLSGATDTEIIVLDMSIEWSKRAIYRNEDPHYKVSYVKGNCNIYCCQSHNCPEKTDFRCIPAVDKVLNIVRRKLKSEDRA